MTNEENSAKPQLLGFPGSLRRESHSRAILAGLSERAAPRADLTIYPLHSVPMYNEDNDSEVPDPGVGALRDAIAGADAILIALPEYNHGLPGVVKNMLDWVSRPHGRGALSGKPILYVTCSPGPTGGVRAHNQLNETLLSLGARILVRPRAAIGLIHQKVEDGRLVDEPSLLFLDEAVADLLRMITRPR